MNYSIQSYSESELVEDWPNAPEGFISIKEAVGSGQCSSTIVEAMLCDGLLGISRGRFKMMIKRFFYATEPKIVYIVESVDSAFKIYVWVTQLPILDKTDIGLRFHFNFCVTTRG